MVLFTLGILFDLLAAGQVVVGWFRRAGKAIFGALSGLGLRIEAGCGGQDGAGGKGL